MTIKWLPIEQCPKQEGSRYLVSGWAYNVEGGEQWYAICQVIGRKFYEDASGDELYLPTHFAFFNPVE